MAVRTTGRGPVHLATYQSGVRASLRLTQFRAGCTLVVVVPGIRPGISFPSIPSEILAASPNRIAVVLHRGSMVGHADTHDTLCAGDRAEMRYTRRFIAATAPCDRRGVRLTLSEQTHAQQRAEARERQNQTNATSKSNICHKACGVYAKYVTLAPSSPV